MDDTKVCGFLDIKSGEKKYSALKKRSSLSSKRWKRLWCSVKSLGPELGVQVQFNRKIGFDTLFREQCESDNCITIPSNAVVHRVQSNTRPFAFAISVNQTKRPFTMLSLSANSETETQRWMANIRDLLKPRSCTTGKFYVSIIDNAHSKAADLIGLHGDLITSETGISIRDIHTGELFKRKLYWTEFYGFHLASTGRPEDVKHICVMETVRRLHCGIGELHLFCLDAHNLVQDLVTQSHGKCTKKVDINHEYHLHRSFDFPSFLKDKRPKLDDCLQEIPNYPLLTTWALDSASTVENVYQSEPNIEYNEDNDYFGLAEFNTSVASGIYEEIVEDVCPSDSRDSDVYQNYFQLFLPPEYPPPLPPRGRQIMKTEMDEVRKYLCGKNPFQSTEMHMQETELDNHSYVPMSQLSKWINGFKSNVAETLEEENYVLMR